MEGKKLLQKFCKKSVLAIIGIFLVIAAMLLLFIHNEKNSTQATSAFLLEVYFDGQYKIGDGEWNPIEKDQHISASQGDVTLQGQFHLQASTGEYFGVAGEGTPIALYMNHIQLTVQEEGQPACLMDVESEFAGNSFCGAHYLAYILNSDAPVTLTFHNPHQFGNENAVDEFLQEVAIYGDSSFEKEIVAEGDFERNIGIFFLIAAFALLGTALFSTLLHIDGSDKIWLIGLSVLFAGGYFAYSAKGVSFWQDSIVGNTTLLGTCMMLYMLCMCILTRLVVKKTLQKLATGAVVLLGAVCVSFAMLCIFTNTRFYDTWLWWVILQSAVNILLLICLAFSFRGASRGRVAVIISSMIFLIGFEVDVFATAMGWWQGGVASQNIFIVLFFIATLLAWQIIPHNINAARKAKEMEAEQKAIRAQLQEQRIAIMIRQIQPHFIYNTLGTIQQLCKENPEQAAKLVHNFSLYLRGNFSELDNTVPIRFQKELEHVRCYTEIEQMRFPDMSVHFDIQTDNFLVPALSVQPLVENAIKHGLMGLEEGGTVTITAFETQTHYCVRVADDGVGFDELEPQDGRTHIGIRNVRERLQVMCGGILTVESEKGKGTTALIQIPKEGNRL